jgi:hypothetical protein
MKRTIKDGLRENDVIKNNHGKRKVLGVCGGAVILSETDKFKSSYGTYTVEELIECNYEIEEPKTVSFDLNFTWPIFPSFINVKCEVKKPHFELDDLRSGMQVETRDGCLMFVLKGTEKGSILIDVGGTNWDSLDHYNSDLSHISWNKYDIMKVFKLTYVNNCASNKQAEKELIYEREKVNEMTKEEAEKLISEKTGKKTQIK